MATLLFTNYNNYFNRIKMRPNNSDAVSGYSSYTLKTLTDYDFNPGDDVNTSVILEDFTGALNGAEPNYLIVYTPPKTNVDSRWFITDIDRTRGGQWMCQLKRDVIIDYLDDVLNSPVFIEKGWVNYDNPLIFNDEAMRFNQIKTSEKLLKDATKLAWIVGYYAKDDNGSQRALTGSFKQNIPLYDTVASLSSLPFYSWRGATVYNKDYLKNSGSIQLKTKTTDLNGETYFYSITTREHAKGGDIPDSNNAYFKLGIPGRPNTDIVSVQTAAELAQEEFNGSTYKPLIKSQLSTAISGTAATYNQYTTALAYDGKIIFVSGESKYYKLSVKVNTVTYDHINPYFLSSSNPITNSFCAWGLNCQYLTTISGANQNNTVTVFVENLPVYVVDWEDITSEYTAQTTTEFYYNTMGGSLSGRITTSDAPYDMFCMPYPVDSDSLKVRMGGQTWTLDKTITLYTAMTIAETSEVYDIQLLPYCPLIDAGFSWDNDNDRLDIPNYSWTFDAQSEGAYPQFAQVYIRGESPTVNYTQALIFHCSLSSFGGSISGPDVGLEDVIDNAKTRKLDTMTHMTRLCSPNYGSVFEFNKQKNNGVSYWEYNCTYKPFTPYIQINPNWSGLYGSDFNDNRGLICAGDFSLARTSDIFKEYALQNKNYQKTFQRQIDYQEWQNKYSNIEQLIGFHTQAAGLQGAGNLTGAGAGSAAGPYGALIGYAAGGVAGAFQGLGSIVGGWADLLNTRAKQRQSIKYQQDQWGYQLDNIKAQPNTLTNVSAFDINNKIFPFIEEYSCTPEEFQAASYKIQYNSMSIGVIGLIPGYLNSGQLTYIKGDLIRFNPTKSVDTHMNNEIAEELYMGIYI